MDQRGFPGGRDYKYNREAATKSLPHQFGVAKHFISSLTGETEEGNATKDQFIQDSYVENLAKVDDLDTRLIQFDLKRLFLVSTLISGIDVTQMTNPKNLFNSDQVDMIHNWEKITWTNVMYWQYAIKKRSGALQRDSNNWALLLVYN